jgi:hypothetical protein
MISRCGGPKLKVIDLCEPVPPRFTPKTLELNTKSHSVGMTAVSSSEKGWGVGQSLAVSRPRTGASSIQGFFSRRRRFLRRLL